MANGTDAHIKFDGIEGESKHEGHKGEIDLISWSWQISNESHSAGTGHGRGKAKPGPVKFTHAYDKASPVLAKKCAQGAHFDKVVLSQQKPTGGGQQDFLKITMKEVFITSLKPSLAESGDGLPREDVEMMYGHIEFSYKAQDAKGNLGGEVTFGWDPESTKVG